MNKMNKEAIRTNINYEALGENIVVDPEFKEKTDAGILIPENMQEDPSMKKRFMKVVAIGEKVEHIWLGDEITPEHSAFATKLTIDGKTYLSFKNYEIIGKKFIHPNLKQLN